MNKKIMIGGCAPVAIAGNVFAADESISYFAPYAGLKGGYAFLGKRNDIKYKGGFAGAVELGVSYDAWRLGLELGYKSNKIKEAEGGYKALGKASFTDANCIARNNIHTAAAGLASCNHIANNNLSLFVLEDTAGGGNPLGFPVFGITDAAFAAACGRANAGAVAQYDKIMALRKVSYFELQKLTALTGMVNVFYDYAMTDAWSLYAGVGLGVARVNYTVKSGNSDPDKAVILRGDAGNHAFPVNTITDTVMQKGYSTLLPADKIIKTEASKTVFAWQLMAGVGYEFNENWKLTLGYKLFNTAKVKQNIAGKEYEIKTPFNHTAEVGLTYTF
jgi:opacity protein-like surface antigen